MSPLSRKLRPRERILPMPPNFNEVVQNKGIIYQKEQPLYINNQSLEKLANDENRPISEIISEEKLLNTLNSSRKQRINVLDELGELLKQGITKNLTKTVIEPTQDSIDYSKIKQIQYSRAAEDYKAAGKTLGDSGLFSNASISYVCAVLSKLLATNSVQESYKEFQSIIGIIEDKQIIKSSSFSILTHLFEALANKDTIGIKRQIAKIHLIETISSDDQELINDSINFIQKLKQFELS